MMALKEENGPSQAATARDYVDKADGTGLFSTTKVKDLQWWSNEKEDEDSVYALTYLAEYRALSNGWYTTTSRSTSLCARMQQNYLVTKRSLCLPLCRSLTTMLICFVITFLAAAI
jgi:hypothetical protein